MANPVMKVKMERIHQNRSYAQSLNHELYDLEKRVKELQTKKLIAAFLMRHDEDTMRYLITETAGEIRRFEP